MILVGTPGVVQNCQQENRVPVSDLAITTPQDIVLLDVDDCTLNFEFLYLTLLETTGLSCQRSAIIELAAELLDPNGVVFPTPSFLHL